MIKAEFRSELAPHAALEVLRGALSLWRESELSPELQSSGVVALEASLSDDALLVDIGKRFYGPMDRAIALRMRARAKAMSEGGSLIAVHIEYEWRAPLALGAMLLATAGVAAWSRTFLVGAVFALIVGTCTLQYVLRRDANRGLTARSEPIARYMLQRAEQALASTR